MSKTAEVSAGRVRCNVRALTFSAFVNRTIVTVMLFSKKHWLCWRETFARFVRFEYFTRLNSEYKSIRKSFRRVNYASMTINTHWGVHVSNEWYSACHIRQNGSSIDCHQWLSYSSLLPPCTWVWPFIDQSPVHRQQQQQAIKCVHAGVTDTVDMPELERKVGWDFLPPLHITRCYWISTAFPANNAEASQSSICRWQAVANGSYYQLNWSVYTFHRNGSAYAIGYAGSNWLFAMGKHRVVRASAQPSVVLMVAKVAKPWVLTATLGGMDEWKRLGRPHRLCSS